MNKEDRSFIEELGKKIDTLIDKECDKTGLDRAYFEFSLKADLLSSNFEKLGSILLLDDHQGYCSFCGIRTYFYDHKNNMHLCAKHFKCLNKEGS